MLNRVFSTVVLSSCLSIGALVSGNGLGSIAQTPQETNSSATTPEISPAKRALIKELLTITEASKNANRLMDSMVRSELPKIVSAVLKDAPYLSGDRPEVQKQFSEIVSNLAIKYRDRLIQKIDINQLIEQVSYPIYDKYFTETELRDIIGFYQSSTGKKAISLMPQIASDSFKRTNEILLPKMSSVMTEIIAEELLNALPKTK